MAFLFTCTATICSLICFQINVIMPIKFVCFMLKVYTVYVEWWQSNINCISDDKVTSMMTHNWPGVICSTRVEPEQAPIYTCMHIRISVKQENCTVCIGSSQKQTLLGSHATTSKSHPPQHNHTLKFHLGNSPISFQLSVPNTYMFSFQLFLWRPK